MAHQVAVIGMGRFGSTLARELYRIGHDVLIIDRDELLAHGMVGQVTYVVTGDATSPDLLEEVGIGNIDTAVVAIGTDIQSSVLVTVLLKQQFNIGHVIARATNEVHGKTLVAIGVDRVVYPEQETGLRTAHSLFQREVQEYMELTSDFGFSKLVVTPDMEGKTVQEAGFSVVPVKHGATVVAIKRGPKPILKPSNDDLLKTGDVLVIGSEEGVLERVRPQ